MLILKKIWKYIKEPLGLIIYIIINRYMYVQTTIEVPMYIRAITGFLLFIFTINFLESIYYYVDDNNKRPIKMMVYSSLAIYFVAIFDTSSYEFTNIVLDNTLLMVLIGVIRLFYIITSIFFLLYTFENKKHIFLPVSIVILLSSFLLYLELMNQYIYLGNILIGIYVLILVLIKKYKYYVESKKMKIIFKRK